MADITGTYELGPATAGCWSRPGARGLAARAGHDLTMEITRWSGAGHGARMPRAAASPAATLTAELDLGSLDGPRGHGRRQAAHRPGPQGHPGPGAQDPRRRGAGRLRLGQRVIPSPSAGSAADGAIEGTLTMHGTSRPHPAPGQSAPPRASSVAAPRSGRRTSASRRTRASSARSSSRTRSPSNSKSESRAPERKRDATRPMSAANRVADGGCHQAWRKWNGPANQDGRPGGGHRPGGRLPALRLRAGDQARARRAGRQRRRRGVRRGRRLTGGSSASSCAH